MVEVQKGEEWLQQLQLNTKLPNRARPIDLSELEALRTPVIAAAKAEMQEHQQEYTAAKQSELAQQLQELEALKGRQVQQLNLQLDSSGQAEHFKAAKKEERLSRIERVFNEYETWVHDTLTIEPVPFIQIIAVFTREDH